MSSQVARFELGNILFLYFTRCLLQELVNIVETNSKLSTRVMVLETAVALIQEKLES